MSLAQRSILAFICFMLGLSAAHAQGQFGFDNRKPSGQPYLAPEESLKRMKVPAGWEVKLVAAEPDIINPIAFTFDERGRMWVLECFEYPKRTPKGKKPRDRIKIIEEDPKGGRPKVTIFAEGKDLPIGWDLATGLEVGHGGVFLGAPPYLFFIENKNDKPGKQRILLKGFGSQDTHETLNTLQWGPDGKLYGLHGVFTHSEVQPGDAGLKKSKGEETQSSQRTQRSEVNDDYSSAFSANSAFPPPADEPEASATGVKMNAAVWRYDVRSKKFDIFAEGTSNPWGMDFDSRGNCFVCCCVIPHLFHMVPGGVYKRQAGSSFNPHAFGAMPEICDHTHHKTSGWAHAGLLVMEGDHVPKAYQGSVLMGSIHGCCIKRDVLRPNGSTFIASCAPDFLTSGDKNFRPINLRWGPDGSIYVIDWHDQNPCHQAAPDSWDYERGRIYKIQRKGAKSRPWIDLSGASSKALADALEIGNPYWYRTALRLLSERRDRTVAQRLKRWMRAYEKDETIAVRYLWALYAIGAFDETIAAETLASAGPAMRTWAVRLLGESGKVSDKMLARLVELAANDPSPQVRLQLASTAHQLAKRDTLPLLHNLMKHKDDARDPYLALMIWLAYEPRLLAARGPELDWLKENASGNRLVTNEIVPRAMRRLVATARAEDLEACVRFMGELRDSTVRVAALDGLVQALKDRQVDAPASWKRVSAELSKEPDRLVRELARRLAVHFQDPIAIAQALESVRDRTLGTTERTTALRQLAVAHPPRALPVLKVLLWTEDDAQFRAEVCRTLSAYDNAEIPTIVLTEWKSYPPLVRGEAVNLLSGRKPWAAELLAAIGKGTVPRTDLNNNHILRIHALKDKNLDAQIEKVWGRLRRDTPKELAVLIDKVRGQLHEGKGSFARGKIVFENQCAKCHKFSGKGHTVGPELDGASRDIEYLLVNILDPNRVVGQPYYVRTIERKDGRIETGLLVAEDDQSVTLKSENDAVKVIQRKDIEGKIRVQNVSMMPEGLAKNMSVQDFRDLIRYVMAHPFLTDVKVAGPFSDGKEFPFDPKDPLASKDVKWTRPVVGPPGRIPLPAIKKSPGFSYVVAEVTAPKAIRTRLQFSSAHAVQVLLNGKSIYIDKAHAKEPAPDQTSIEVQLEQGVNRLVFQVTYQGEAAAFYARLLDPARALRHADAK